MENFNLCAYGVQEMSMEEMLLVDGGNIFGKIVSAIGSAVDWIEDHKETVTLVIAILALL